jgi:RpiB/LacA/LacB family sugar-phosphate isomerase
MIFIASDHGGFKLKSHVAAFLKKSGFEFEDLGPLAYKANDDYPDFAAKVGEKVSKNPKQHVGILLCRSGQGVNIVANKFKNVRAALVWNEKEAKASRTDDLANVLSLPSDYIVPSLANKIVKTWLNTPLGTQARHLRRIRKIVKLEKR